MIEALVQNISGMIDSLQKKAMAMKDTAGELSDLASDTEGQAHEAARSAKSTMEQTHTVSESTRLLQSGMADIGTRVSEQQVLVEDISRVAKRSGEDIRELAKASEQISEIVDIVKNLSGETRLLALNARIEAARSGAAGKGFNVVAGEIKNFSCQTEAAGEDIAVKIEAIQRVCRTVIENTGRIEHHVEQLIAAGHHINTSVKDQSTVTRRIAQNTHDTGRDITDVSERMCHVTEAALSTSRFAHNVQSLSEEIAKELTTLLADTREKTETIC